MVMLRVCISREKGMKQRIYQSLLILSLACVGGYSPLGYSASTYKGVEILAIQGHADAQVNLAYMYLN